MQSQRFTNWLQCEPLLNPSRVLRSHGDTFLSLLLIIMISNVMFYKLRNWWMYVSKWMNTKTIMVEKLIRLIHLRGWNPQRAVSVRLCNKYHCYVIFNQISYKFKPWISFPNMASNSLIAQRLILSSSQHTWPWIFRPNAPCLKSMVFRSHPFCNGNRRGFVIDLHLGR